MVSTKRTFGNQCEEYASTWLKKRGMHIIARNFLCRYGELDIVAIDQGTLVFVEVKARKNTNFGLGFQSITTKKLSKIARAGEYFRLHSIMQLPAAMRIDAISILVTPSNEYQLEYLPTINTC